MKDIVKEILMEKRDYKPKADSHSIKNFIEGVIHTDFQCEILARIEQMRDFMEDCKSNEYLETRGGIKALRLTMGIFNDLMLNRIADLESEQQEKENEKTV